MAVFMQMGFYPQPGAATDFIEPDQLFLHVCGTGQFHFYYQLAFFP